MATLHLTLLLTALIRVPSTASSSRQTGPIERCWGVHHFDLWSELADRFPVASPLPRSFVKHDFLERLAVKMTLLMGDAFEQPRVI